MAGIGLVIDPVSEDAGNAQLDINDGASLVVIDEPSFPTPELDPQWASSSDTEGAVLASTRHQNRTITIPVRVYGGTAAGFDAQLAKVQQKVGKIVREGGTLKLTVPSGKTVVYDLLDATVAVPTGQRFTRMASTDVTLTFTAKPYSRGAPVAYGTHTESTLPVLVFTETLVAGDVPAVGQLVVTEAQGVDQRWLTWGVQSRFYDPAGTAALFYEAEALTPLGVAAAAVGPAGASGSTTNKVVSSGALSPVLRGMVSSQAAGGGAHWTHVGSYRVYARVQSPGTNSGEVTVAVEWAVGDFRLATRNDPATITTQHRGTWRLVDLGMVTLPAVPVGAQRWEARVLASSSTVGDVAHVDYLMLIPADEGSGVAESTWSAAAPAALTARDEFDQAAGPLDTQTAPVGGTWSSGGDADDFYVNQGGDSHARRAAVGDSGFTGRYATLSSTAGMTTSLVQIDVEFTGDGSVQLPLSGPLARFVDASNWLLAAVQPDTAGSSGMWRLFIEKNTAGSVSSIASVTTSVPYTQWATVRLYVDDGGRFAVWVYQQGQPSSAPVLTGNDSALATGGTLASGKAGIFDVLPNTGTSVRYFDNFLAYVPVKDAAVFASQQLQVRGDGVLRQDSTGSYWQPPSTYEGDYLRVPAAGQEARTTRVIVKAARNDPASMSDAGIDDLSAQLTVIPRYLVVPE